MFNYLLEKGHSQESLEKVYAPVGVNINSQTPFEIALSIVTEIVKLRNSKK